jgi:predicted dehydrogenase
MGQSPTVLLLIESVQKMKGVVHMLRIAMLSKWHVHAENYAQFIQDQPDAQITCVWDEDAARGKGWGKTLNVPFIPDLDALLARPDVDAVIIDSPTSMHRELMVKAAKAGKHIFTEKCMCLTVKDCDEVISAVEKAGVIFTISFPQRARGRSLLVKKLIEEGTLGDVTLVRTRSSHNGALAGWLPDYWFDPGTTGGGAMMDLGAHPMYLARWLLGKPTRIQSMFANLTGHAVEDNSVCTIEFENGAIAVSETSLVSGMNPQSMEVYGTEGVIICENASLRLRTRQSMKFVEGGWFDVKLPDNEPAPLRQFLDSVLYGKPVNFGPKEGRELT